MVGRVHEERRHGGKSRGAPDVPDVKAPMRGRRAARDARGRMRGEFHRLGGCLASHADGSWRTFSRMGHWQTPDLIDAADGYSDMCAQKDAS